MTSVPVYFIVHSYTEPIDSFTIMLDSCLSLRAWGKGGARASKLPPSKSRYLLLKCLAKRALAVAGLSSGMPLLPGGLWRTS